MRERKSRLTLRKASPFLETAKRTQAIRRGYLPFTVKFLEPYNSSWLIGHDSCTSRPGVNSRAWAACALSFSADGTKESLFSKYSFLALHNQVVSKTKGYNFRECAPRQIQMYFFILENILVAIILTRYLFCVKEQSLERNTCQLL